MHFKHLSLAVFTAFFSILGLTANAAAYTADDYSKYGLVAMWDCSAGLSDTGWKDTSGTYEFTWSDTAISDGVTYSSAGVVFPGVKTAYADLNSTDRNATFKVAGGQAGTHGTFEVVFRCDDGSFSSSKATAAVFQEGINDGCVQGVVWKKDGGYRFVSHSASGSNTSLLPICGTLVSSVTHRYYASKPTRIGASYINGLKPTLKSGTGMTGTGYGVRLGNATGTGLARAFKGTIYAVRVYNRLLSTYEIEQHAKIDAARFDDSGAAKIVDEPFMAMSGDAEVTAGFEKNLTSANGIVYKVLAYTNTVDTGFAWTAPGGVDKIELLVVGGGGSGSCPKTANCVAGGAGAGGLVHEQVYGVTPGVSYAIKVGAGGDSVSATSSDGKVGAAGRASSFSNEVAQVGIVAMGGGAGGLSAGGDGGCGGGASRAAAAGVSLQLSTYGYGMGYDGAANSSGSYGWGFGGGGATQSGQSSGAAQAENVAIGCGGAGYSCSITGDEREYARGGDSGGNSSGSTRVTTGGWGAPGVDGRGNGGMSSSGYRPTKSGKGGDGTVIIRYAPMAKVTVNYDGTKAAYVAECLEEAVVSGGYVNIDQDVTVTAYPIPGSGYQYEEIPEGWIDAGDGKISKTIKATEDIVVDVPDPTSSGPVVKMVTISVTAPQTVSYTAMIGEAEIGTTVPTNSVVDFVVSPVEHYEYAEAPSGWTMGKEGQISKTVIAAENPTEVVIPSPTRIRVVVGVTELENTSCAIYSGETEVKKGDMVDSGSTLTVVVTPDADYHYTDAPEGWTLNDDGTLTREYEAVTGMDIVVPNSHFDMKKVALALTSGGVSYVATNTVSGTRVRNGNQVYLNAMIEIRAVPYSSAYVLTGELGEGWQLVDGAIVGTFNVKACGGAIDIPKAVWTPTDGELIENGGFEFFDENQFSSLSRFPTSLEGSWIGYEQTLQPYQCYGLWKNGSWSYHSDWQVNGSPHSGTYAAGSNGYGGKSPHPYIYVTFKTPSASRSSTGYRLKFFAKTLRSTYDGTLKVDVMNAACTQVIQSLESGKTALAWAEHVHTLTGLAADTTYAIRFCSNASDATSFAIDDVSLKMLPPKGLVILIQ